MNYLMFINQIKECMQQPPQVRFLVSGSDPVIQKAVLKDVLSGCRRRDEAVIIVDDTENTVDLDTVSAAGYQIKNGMSGAYCLYNPFQITTTKGITRIRQILKTLEYDEKQKGKLISYLNFIRHLELIGNENRNFELTLEKLGEYCTVLAVEEKLKNYVEEGFISERQRDMLLRKYSECAEAGADLEDMFFLLMPYIHGTDLMRHCNRDKAFVFRTGELGEDETARSLVMQLLQFGLEENSGNNVTVLVFDKGYGSRSCVFNLLKSLTSKVQLHVFSTDIFTLCDAPSLSMIMNRFPARVYGHHLVMSSAESIEKICGEIDVPKFQKTIAYDRRLMANTPWDILLGNNKTEAYMEMAAVREPRYRKEMILSFPMGSGIVEFMGNTSVFAV
ncbi:MAG: hypothetical protein Q4F28_10865 [Eubacteriales bacterium]|nr:hypothetical protein [Eubacteriales bacterium]